MRLDKILNFFEPKKVLDIGAHIGGFHDELRTIYPTFERYFAIEANSECEPYLKSKSLEYRIQLMGSDENVVDFYNTKETKISTGSSIFRELTHHFSDDVLIIEKKKMTTLNSIFEETEIFDLVKIDTQGSELEILKGGDKILKNSKGILLEVSVLPYNEGAPLYDEVLKFMDDYGFEPKEIIGENRYGDGTVFQLDILFMKRN
jgi:FkbM family methyltransferase